jgi:hypothetical protein
MDAYINREERELTVRRDTTLTPDVAACVERARI